MDTLCAEVARTTTLCASKIDLNMRKPTTTYQIQVVLLFQLSTAICIHRRRTRSHFYLVWIHTHTQITLYMVLVRAESLRLHRNKHFSENIVNWRFGAFYRHRQAFSINIGVRFTSTFTSSLIRLYLTYNWNDVLSKLPDDLLCIKIRVICRFCSSQGNHIYPESGMVMDRIPVVRQHCGQHRMHARVKMWLNVSRKVKVTKITATKQRRWPPSVSYSLRMFGVCVRCAPLYD